MSSLAALSPAGGREGGREEVGDGAGGGMFTSKWTKSLEGEGEKRAIISSICSSVDYQRHPLLKINIS